MISVKNDQNPCKQRGILFDGYLMISVKNDKNPYKQRGILFDGYLMIHDCSKFYHGGNNLWRKFTWCRAW
jgi:hypothetical protein